MFLLCLCLFVIFKFASSAHVPAAVKITAVTTSTCDCELTMPPSTGSGQWLHEFATGSGGPHQRQMAMITRTMSPLDKAAGLNPGRSVCRIFGSGPSNRGQIQ